MPDWRRRKSRKLTEKRDEAAQKLAATNQKIAEIKTRIAREARGAGGKGGGYGAGYNAGLTPTGERVAEEVEVEARVVGQRVLRARLGGEAKRSEREGRRPDEP